MFRLHHSSTAPRRLRARSFRTRVRFRYGVSIVRDQYVTQIVAIFSRQCDTFEISFKRPAALGSNRMMLGADGGDAVTLWSHCVKQMQ